MENSKIKPPVCPECKADATNQICIGAWWSGKMKFKCTSCWNEWMWDKNPPVEPVKDPWIPVSERLPETRQRVLFSTNNGDVHEAIYMETLINQYCDFKNVFMSSDGGHYQLSMDIVTHWMPLPKAPNAV